ncbi:MAG: hypothetical protein R3B72_49935, partial [Polyangiaceae bacterium]
MRGDGRDGRGGGGGNQPPPLTKGYPGRGGGLGRPSGLEGQRVPGASATPSPGRETADERRLAEAQQAAPQPKPRPVTVTARSAPAQAPTPIEAPTPSLPKGGGALRSIAEAFTVSPSGSGQMAIPLPLSPGRAGFGPELRLS